MKKVLKKQSPKGLTKAESDSLRKQTLEILEKQRKEHMKGDSM